MADAGKNAITTYASYASEATLLIGFPYLDKDHVVVTSNTTPETTYTRGASDDYTIENSDPTNITWVTKPASGLKITITRDTPEEVPIIEFEAGKPVLAANLNTDLLQVLYYQQEVEDKQS